VRSYLAANCVQCHQPGGGAGWSLWDARISTPTSQAGIINGPLIDDLGDPNNRVITPNDTAHSAMLTRLANLGQDHMPPLATSLINTQAVQLISAWITNDLSSYQDFTDWQVQYFGSTNNPADAAMADFDGDGAANYLEYLTGTDPTNRASHWNISLAVTGGVTSVNFLRSANRGFEVQSTTHLTTPVAWIPLDSTENAPFFSITNQPATVHDPVRANTQFYRVRVFEP